MNNSIRLRSPISLTEGMDVQPDFPLPYLNVNQGYAFLGTMGQIPALEGFTKGKPFLDKAIEFRLAHQCVGNLEFR